MRGIDPLPGMAVVAEYVSRFDADVAVAMLWDAGLEGAILGDPAHSVAPHHVTERMFRIVVREEVAEDARDLLRDGIGDTEADALDALYHRRPLADRPTWFRWAAWSLFWAIPGTFIVALTLIALSLLRGLFP
ncbi:MAG TPA: hypothetical protein VIS05_03370 [Ilumatobacter sp.]